MEIATIIIQRTFRGHVGRKKVRNLKVFIHRICIQNRLETPLGQILFRIERNGAAVIIQNWFRYRISYCKKVLWTKKYRKFIVWRKKFIVLRRAITKSKGYTFHMSEILADKIELRRVASIVICRLVRGFLARKRIHKFISIKLEYLTARRLAAIHIQKQIRKYLIRTKYPSIGIRFVMLLIKNRRWLSYSQNITHGSQILADLSVEASDINIDVIFNRRASFMYRNIRLGDSVFLDILEDCASRIQLSYRKYKTRKAFRLMVQNRNIIRVLRIQHWFIGWTWRRRVKSALSVIQPIWGFKARRLILVRKAILTIQSSWRFYEKRTHIQEVLLMKANRRKRIRMWANELTIVRRERKVTMLQRSRLEMVEAGALLYAATELRWHAYYLLQGARKVKSHTASHELQKLFSALSLNGMLDSGKLLKYLKESKKVLTSDFNASTVELQFSKVKDPTEKRIDYKQFVDLLTNFAILKFLATDKPNIETKKTTSNEEAGRLDNLTDSFAFAGLTGSSALLIKFVLTFLQPTSEYKRATDTLGSKSAELIASNYISDGVRNIQRFVRNKIIIRKLTAHLQELQRQKLQRKKWNSAIKLQNLIRRFLGRRLVVRLAQNVYNKYIDGESDRPYWYNPRTEVAFWTKPKLLGAFDCGMATRMPLAEEEFKILCSLCEKISSTTYCVECKEPFCTPCYSSGHKAGNRASHKHLIMENCVQCEYQIGTRYCKNCGDVFCDSCYKYVHKNGRLRFHVCQRLCERCDNCQDYTAQWKETNSSSQENGKSALLYSQFWCNVCFKRERGCLGSEYESDYLHKVAFYGRSHRDFKLKYEEEMRKKNVAELFLNRTIEIERMKKVRAAIIIQRVVRGYWKRKEIADFVAERKAFMRFRKEEEATRNSISYIILCWIGFPPPLQSDTPLERVMKLYPPYKHHILAAAIENQWGLACRLLIEHEERLKQHPPASVYQKLRAAFREWQSRSRLQNANKNHSDKCRIFTDAELQYRNVSIIN